MYIVNTISLGKLPVKKNTKKVYNKNDHYKLKLNCGLIYLRNYLLKTIRNRKIKKQRVNRGLLFILFLFCLNYLKRAYTLTLFLVCNIFFLLQTYEELNMKLLMKIFYVFAFFDLLLGHSI